MMISEDPQKDTVWKLFGNDDAKCAKPSWLHYNL